MSGFVEGLERSQSALFSLPCLTTMSPRTIRFARLTLLLTVLISAGQLVGLRRWKEGRPCYHPATLLKIYIYGYLNRVPSSRRLERECQRNIELIWLTGHLAPDFKTIADFRKDNGKAIREVCRSFVAVCRELDLLNTGSVAIDGSKFKAVNARDKNFTEAEMKRRLERIEESIARYMEQLETADRRGDAVPQAKVARFKDKIEKLNEEIARLDAIGAEMMKSEDKQNTMTDPDARSMATSGKDTGIVGYNVQTAVDTENHLIVAHEVTNVGTDRHQLSNMAEQAQTEMGVETLDVVADRGYYDGEEVEYLRGRRHHGDVAEADDLGCQGCRSLRQTGLRLYRHRRCLSLSRRRAAHLSLYECRGRKDTAPLLDECLQNMRAESAVHDRPRATHLTLGARGRSGESSGSARPQSWRNGYPPSDKHSIRSARSSIDGSNALSHETAAKSGNRNGAQCARLQHQARHGDHRRGRATGGPGDLSRGMLRIQINASRRPRERPGRSENGFQEKLRLSAQMPAVFCARCRYEAFFTQPGPKPALGAHTDLVANR